MSVPSSRFSPRLRVAVYLALLATFLGAGVAFAHIKAVKTQPEEGALLTRPVRALRVWLSAEPNVEVSKLSLTGPAGKLEITGLHSMGDNDLMGRVVGSMPDGEYTATWESAAVEDGHVRNGEWKFTVQRSAE